MKPSASAVRVVIGGLTIRLRISTEPMRAGVSRMFMTGPAGSQYRNLAAVEVDGRSVHPGGARGDQEGHQIGHVLDRAVAGDIHLAAELLADLRFRLSGPFHFGTDALPLPLGLDQARMNAIDLHAILLAEVGKAFGEGGNGGI